MTTSNSVLDEAVWREADATGTLLGCVMALFCAAILQRLVSRHVMSSEKVLVPLSSRGERLAKLLKGLSVRTATAAAVDKAHPLEGATTDWNESETTTSGTSAEESESDEVDTEYEEMEALRLKMVFVVRSPMEPRITAQEVVALTVSAGVELVELLLGQTTLGKTASVFTPGSSSCIGNAQDQQRWHHWYRCWNRVGCGKITLKCPDKDTMELVVATAQEHRLPMAQLRRSGAPGGRDAQAVVPKETSDLVVVALGPAPSDVLEPITGSLKLYS
ncbi:hypothetical protein JKF63_03025 [Porcisia hertigi]|uniref:peptidyl-tRNA hydrolase n=1 Tax=Porcisia hertigi TaxID=2761500 RepID=A0A836I5K2_9TRYP|nr:hypothetical protein JKF63_03025 [Porcisia hertigi]